MLSDSYILLAWIASYLHTEHAVTKIPLMPSELRHLFGNYHWHIFFLKDFKSRTKAVYYIDMRVSKQSLFSINPWAVQAEKAHIHLSERRKKTL